MVSVAIMGHGVVGSGVAEILLTHKQKLFSAIGEEIYIKKILDLREFPDSPIADRFTKDFEEIIKDLEIRVVVEVMGGLNPAYDFNAPRSLDNFPYMLANTTYRAEALALKNDPAQVDPRLKLVAGQPYVDPYIDAQGRTTVYDRSSEANNRPDRLAWAHRKYTNIRGVEMGPAPYGKNESSDCNIYLIRMADIYLLYAELLADKDAGTALEYVNKVHRRAYGFPPDGASPVDYSSLSDRTKTYEETDPLAHDPLRYERWAELFGEGQWWFDIRRYRNGDTEAAYYKETSHGPITWKGDCSYVQPIPQLELERNHNMKQSEGYPGI